MRMQDCAYAILNGMGFPHNWKEVTHNFILGLGLNTPYRSYVAYWDGKPVSTAAVLFGTEVAGIYTIATLPEARGKGFGAAVTLAPLLDARKWAIAWERCKLPKWDFPFTKEWDLRRISEWDRSSTVFNFTFDKGKWIWQ